MLRMDKVYVIRHKMLVEGKSIRAVARELGIGRNTVSKHLQESEPVRRETEPRPRPVLSCVAPRIDELLEEWTPRTTCKQRTTGSRVHRQLVEEGYRVGITTVREYLREKRRQVAEVYIPLIHRPGDEAQVDFFEVTVDEDGIRHKAWKFLLRLMYSGRDFAWLYEHCDQLSFLDGHVRAFSHLGGVPRRLVYDNLTSAVKRRVGLDPELTERFLALSSHYLFEPCFARPGEGHDKGGVEARGKGIRLEHLTPIPEGKTLREISERLLWDLDRSTEEKVNEEGRTVAKRFAEEVPKLTPLPSCPFEARRVQLVTVSRRALVRVEGAQYSVPSTWAGLSATAYVGVEDIRLCCFGEEVTRARVKRGRRSVRYRHYFPELAKKPQAVRQVAPELLAELGEPYGKLWDLLTAAHGERDAARVLSKIVGAVAGQGEERVCEALDRVLRQLQGAAAAEEKDSLFSEGPTLPLAQVPEGLQGYTVEAARASDYDVLLVGARR